MAFDQFRWESVDLTNTTYQADFASTATVPPFMYPPYVVKEVLKRVAPKYLFRKYTNKIADYGKGKGDIVMYRKDITPFIQRWKGSLGEFDSLPNTTLSTKMWSVAVDERGLGFPYTERLNVLAYDNPIGMLENHVGIAMQSNIDADLVEKAFGFIDLVYISRQTAGVHSIATSTGYYVLQKTTSANGTLTSVTGTKTFSADASSIRSTDYSVSILEGGIRDNTALSLVGGSGYYKDTPTVSDLKYIKSQLEKKRVPKIGGHYVCLINSSMLYYLMEDSEFKNVVAYSLSERFVEGEIGTVWGFTFVCDDSGVIDNAFTVKTDGEVPSVAIILGADAVREAVALPEQIRRDTPLDAGRYYRMAILTYRGESPVWWSTESEYRGCIYIGKA